MPFKEFDVEEKIKKKKRESPEFAKAYDEERREYEDRKNIWKVKAMTGHEKVFEQLCKENNISYKPYPTPIEGVYRAECSKNKLLDIGFCIATIEEIPMISMS